jgi:hypothetical protein
MAGIKNTAGIMRRPGKTVEVTKQWVRVVFRRRIFVIALLLAQILFVLSLIATSSIAFKYANLILNI